ncbi:hypothetical protein [Agrobacterium vitis]|nr:hypothetical protein [Agrobacterium vitis]
MTKERGLASDQPVIELDREIDAIAAATDRRSRLNTRGSTT